MVRTKKRICRRCGKEYEGALDSSLCPDCVKAQRARGNVSAKTCHACGTRFMGGSRASYCPDCRAERKREANRRCKQRKAAGKVRSPGSEDLCEACGKAYTVTGGLQRYCPDCSPVVVGEKARAAAREWYREKADPVEIKERRRSGAAPISCAVCGKRFTPFGNWITCSQECSDAHAEALKKQWLADNAEHVSQRNKDWYQRKFASMSPEELEAYREDQRARSRERYYTRKAAKEKE